MHEPEDISGAKHSFYPRRGKRILDLCVAIPGVCVLLPIMALIGVLVRLNIGSPVLYRQRRPGLNGRPFVIVKFRTMTDKRDAAGELRPDRDRLTSFGAVLRSTSLDELPELINVIKGEMSLVGPRPLLMQYLDRYSREQMRRHDLLPGITGWAQIHGRNDTTWDERFAHDLWYVGHVSLPLDLRILAVTVWKAVQRERIGPPGQVTMSEFMGDKQPS